MRKLRVTGDPHSFTTACVGGIPSIRLLFVLCFVFTISAGLSLAAEPAPPLKIASQPNAKKILILFSFSDRGDYIGLNLLKSALQNRIPSPIDFNVEYLGGRRLDEQGYEKLLTETLRQTYSGRKLDLVVIQSYTGLEFVVRHRNELFPGVPIIFLCVDPDQIKGQENWSGVTGVTVPTGITETINLALQLHPNANTVAIIIGNSTPDKYFMRRIHAELVRHQDKVREVDLIGLPTSQLMEAVDRLPLRTVVLYELAPQESDQPAIGINDILARVAERLPTYSIFPVDVLDHGGIGGVGPALDWGAELSLVAEDAKRVLSGERPEKIPIANYASLHAMVDWRQLQRWRISESALPPGSVVLYREPTLWERDRNYIIATILVILALSLLIAALLWQRARKRKVEVAMHESEKRFQVMADTTPSLVWMADQDGEITYLNSKSVEFTGDTRAGFGESWSEYVHPDDLGGVLSANARALAKRTSFSKEYRLRRYDGVYRWMFDVASPRVNGDGSFAGFIGSAIDVTDQKVAQDALENVSGRLIEAQEKERSRIARDLHDDICQRLALLSMELEEANRTLNGPSEATNERLEQIQQHCAEIAGDVQALSHELHSSKLEYLGIAAAIRGFCHEFAKQHKVRVDFKDEDVPAHLPKDISLCLFRVVQEALHNAVKYSGTTHFTVTLQRTPSEVVLEVMDNGIGFDVEEAKRNRGLGLVSMQERVHLVHGMLFIESAPGRGTRITASVPLVEDGASAVAAGDEPASISGAA